jgi:hypothetical protein
MLYPCLSKVLMMNRKLIFLSISVACIASFVSCRKEVFREYEPNDTFDHSNLIEVDRSMRGSLSSASDTDCFMINIAEPGSFDIDLSAIKGVNPAIKIYRADTPANILLKTIDDNRKSSPERMRNFWFDRGRYYIVISHGDRDAPKGDPEAFYMLKVSLHDQTFHEEHEPNDIFEQATPIVAGDEVRGFYSPAFNKQKKDDPSQREDDFYSIDIDASLEKPLVADINLTGVPGVTGSLILYDSGKNVLSRSVGTSGSEVSIKGRGIVRSGRYYIDVLSAEYESNHEKPYFLKVTLKDYDRTSELEPNDSIETANLYIDHPIKGSVFPANDKDYFRIQITEPVLLTADVSFNEGVDGIIRLFDLSGKKLVETNSFREGKNERIPSYYVKTDTFIEVSAKTKKQQEAAYELNISKSPYEEGFEIEPNNDRDSATKITGKTIKGYLTYRKDRDFFFLDYSKRVAKKFVITGIDNASFTVSLTDQYGYIIRSERVSKKAGITFRDMIDGKAYLIVDADKENPYEPYTITVGD